MDRRDTLLALLALGATAGPFETGAQQTAKVARIGFLGSASASSWASRLEALRAGLRDFGYVEGKNIVIEYRWADEKYERLPDLAAELVRLKVDILVTAATPGSRAAKQATTTIPIVMAIIGDPIATGIVASLAQPGGNITGSTFFNPELAAKRIELLKEVFPRARRVAVLLNLDNPSHQGPVFQAMEIAAKSLQVELQKFDVRGRHEFESAFSAMAKSHIDSVVIIEDPLIVANAKAIVGIAAKQRLPTIGFKDVVEAGGLMSYGVNILETYRRTAYFVDRILKGSKPSDLPIERATKFELIINMKTARALGITIPQSVLLRANQVIE